MKFSIFATLFALVACGSEDVALSGRLAWNFDYRNWVNEASDADLRSCNNRPDGALDPAVPAYPEVARVRVRLDDPKGEVPGLDDEVACGQGSGSRHYELRGLSERKFDLVIEGKDAADHVMYRLSDRTLDLGSDVDEKLTVPAAVGETRVYPDFSDVVGCPTDLVSIRASFYPEIDNVVATDPNYIIALPECTDGVDELYLRNIPAEPELTAGGGFVPLTYEFKLEGLNDAGEVIYCSGRVTRSIAPGKDNNNDDVTLNPATDCP
jgi:hypothetical protein